MISNVRSECAHRCAPRTLGAVRFDRGGMAAAGHIEMPSSYGVAAQAHQRVIGQDEMMVVVMMMKGCWWIGGVATGAGEMILMVIFIVSVRLSIQL